MVLIVILLFAVSLVEAEVKFGNWDKWDEQLPLADNKAWMSVFPNRVLWKILLDEDSGLTFYFSSAMFFKDKNKSSKTAAKAIFYLNDKSLETEDWKIREAISNATLAIVAFSSKKDEMITIRAYKRDKINAQELTFFEEWEIPNRDEEPVIKKGMSFFKEFVKEFKIEEEDLNILPKILYNEEGSFIIMPGLAYRKS